MRNKKLCWRKKPQIRIPARRNSDPRRRRSPGSAEERRKNAPAPPNSTSAWGSKRYLALLEAVRSCPTLDKYALTSPAFGHVTYLPVLVRLLTYLPPGSWPAVIQSLVLSYFLRFLGDAGYSVPFRTLAGLVMF